MRYNEPVYVISVAARLLELHPQTLRKYEREGFVAPSRTTGNLRLYSARDLEALRQVKHLVEIHGINLAGVQMALEVTNRLHSLYADTARIAAKSEAGSCDHLLDEIEELLNLLGTEVRR